jgi:hypothetical protein
MLLKMKNAPAHDIFIQPKVTFPSDPLTVVGEYDEVTVKTTCARLIDLGVVQIPPWLLGMTNVEFYPVTLALYGRCLTDSMQIDVDFVQITALDSYRWLEPHGYGADYNVRVVDDGMEGWLWTDGWDGGNQRTGHYIGYGQQVRLVPGLDQRLFFLTTVDTGESPNDATLSIRAYYRPRRVTI